jgi:hypothetical protein
VTSDRRQVGLLSRMFFGRLFESDLTPPGLPQVQLVIWVAAFLGGPSTLMPILLSKKYIWLINDPAALHSSLAGDRTVALLLSMIATGLITLVIWEGVFPDRRDGRILGVLPIRVRTFVIARLVALLGLFAALLIVMTACSSISFGAVNATFGGSGGFIGSVVTHFTAAAGLEATVFFGIIAIQCALLNTVGAGVAARLAVAMQITMVVGVFQMPLLLPMLSVPHLPAWAPLIGLATCVVALTMYGASFRRMTRLAMEGTGASTVRRSRLHALVPVAARLTAMSPAARGVCAFTLRTAARSRRHRMLLAGWLGLACAVILAGILPMVLQGWRAFEAPRVAVLAAPLVVTALTLVGMRMLFAIPSEIRANWTVRSGAPVSTRQAVDGAAAALMACVIPAVLLAWVSASVLWGIRVGFIHAAFCAALGIILAQLLALGLDKVPFTCTYMPGKGKFVKFWPVYLFAFSTYTFTMAGLEVQLLKHGGVTQALIILFALAVGASYLRYRRASELMNLRFEEEDPEALTVLPL